MIFLDHPPLSMVFVPLMGCDVTVDNCKSGELVLRREKVKYTVPRPDSTALALASLA